ncbi:glutamate 5-kinase [Rarobacter incanus]|uniref:Glutamate 5-kinase n=1 Tax=Rarobacter incanus TaxID=153494 RepID=A0A542SP43_9MICO|nr:glutamate 5-kinase [Rarobacter incanus]TQK76027.1 glutamate 5-kinase [Rarobacter incanus]
MSDSRTAIAQARRTVVKIGSSSLTGTDGRLNVPALEALVAVLAERRDAGHEVILVTSGAIAAAIAPLGLPGRPRDLATAQAAASVGQGLLIARYTAAFADHGLRVGQLLLTAADTLRRDHYRNAQRSIERLLELGVVPVINENDAVATDEIRFGDNDRLAALVSHVARADALVLLTDVDGLFTAPPDRPGSRHIPLVRGPEDLTGIEVTARGTAVGTGGMVTKLESVRIATASGTPVVLTTAGNARAALAGEPVGTYFTPTGKRTTRKRLWLAFAAAPKGRLILDEGAARAVQGGLASLLPAGVLDVEGAFEAGEPVELVNPAGKVIARGLVAYDSADIPALLGRHTSYLRARLGDGFDRALVHRDDLVLLRRGRKRAPANADAPAGGDGERTRPRAEAGVVPTGAIR